jgi:MFS family permease
VSPASSIGTTVGVAIAGLLIAMPGALPWWGWLLLVVIGIALLAMWAIRRRRAAEAVLGSPGPESGDANGTLGPT